MQNKNSPFKCLTRRFQTKQATKPALTRTKIAPVIDAQITTDLDTSADSTYSVVTTFISLASVEAGKEEKKKKLAK